MHPDEQPTDNLDSWIQQLSQSFRQYPEFIVAVSAKIESLEAEISAERYTHAETLKIAIENAMKPVAVAKTIESEKPEKVSAAPVPAKKFPERKVLLVDDAEINRVLMSHYFKGLPVKLEFALNGDAARQKCKGCQFDLIVIDDEIQSSTGSEIAKSLKTEGAQGLLVALSNRLEDELKPIPDHFSHRLSRGLPRDLFIERLKGMLWVA